MIKAIIDNIKGLYSLLVGLSITGRFFFSPQKTVHYPRQVVDPEILSSYRGPLELVPGEKDPAQSRCICCQMCVRACPGHCLTVTKEAGSKAPAAYLYDFTYCCLCAACVESCPTGAIRFSHKVYLVADSRQALHLDLLADLKVRASAAPASESAAAEQTGT
ncbi:MAG: 4Fe-4S dicluster domain-containing protein [Deltaproteobacteria bacterium]|jgi:NADH-quinone oxidoreductase subunit I|nr:4Fe-4S dicluster domain-containing protein [Deltaproteobacteria bacterium]